MADSGHLDLLSPLHRPLGDTGITVSPVGLGTVKLGRDQGVKYPAAFEIPDDTRARELIVLARELGINLIDTAPAYGHSEVRLGSLLRGQRQHWVICTKAGEEFDNGTSSYCFTPEYIEFSLKRSLQRLQTDYIDIALLHSDGSDLEIIERSGAIEKLDELCTIGLLRAFGVSTKTVDGGLAALERSDMVMATLTPQYRAELPVLERAAELGRGVLLKKVFNSGHIISSGEDNIRTAFALAFDQPAVASAIIGTINPEHLMANAKICEEVLTDQTVS